MRWRHIIWVSPRYPATQLDKARALYLSDEATFSSHRFLLQSPTVMTAAAVEQENGGITEGAKPTIVIPIKGGGEKACQCHCKDKRLGARSRNLFLEAVLSISSICVLIIAVWLLPPLAPHHPTPVSVECWFLAASRKRLQIRNSHNHCRSGTALLLWWQPPFTVLLGTRGR